jgi:trimethylamine:corrinoid methyltransferase-like protein
MKIRRGLSGGQYKPLTEQDIKKIHETSMRVFAEIGVQVNFSEARELFRQAGAEVKNPPGSSKWRQTWCKNSFPKHPPWSLFAVGPKTASSTVRSVVTKSTWVPAVPP